MATAERGESTQAGVCGHRRNCSLKPLLHLDYFRTPISL